MLTFNLKREWFDKIKSGEKTHEYREVKDYWFKRFENMSDNIFFYPMYGWFRDINRMGKCIDELNEECVFCCGYPNKNDKSKRIQAKIKNISICNGLNTDLKIDKDVFDIEFELIKE